MNEVKNIVEKILENMPSDWLRLTTHRLDIYNEERAKTEFLEELEKSSISSSELKYLPTAFDYIRLGHPLSCTLEWAVAKSRGIDSQNVISFSSLTMPILAILRRNLLNNKKTQIVYTDSLIGDIDSEVLTKVYGYNFNLIKVSSLDEISKIEGSTIVLTSLKNIWNLDLPNHCDFLVGQHPDFGSVTIVNDDEKYISEIQHVRRRESIAMTPTDCLSIMKEYLGQSSDTDSKGLSERTKTETLNTISKITRTSKEACLGSSGLSIQYAIMMGLIHNSMDKNPGKKIKFIVPPNCYGGTNDQARRVAACVESVEILDLPVDSGRDMVTSLETILNDVAKEDAIPFIIAEIPTNPRVEVPDLERLKVTLSEKRETKDGTAAIEPVFILDQTFCPNVEFLGEGDYLSTVKTISYVSGSKFPSGGLCTAGYCVANDLAKDLIDYVQRHLSICSNHANNFQIQILHEQMPSMVERINSAYLNTRGFVDHIEEKLPHAKINFVSKELADEGFTPSVFSLDLPTKGDTAEKKEAYKRDLNLKLINLMISNIPNESKYCVSYGQLEGCYWTIPATSTQGTTKEGDKDYIVRVAISPKFDLELHKKTFSEFCSKYIED